ncbi:MAG: hypothetical protein HC835_17025 [Oscillatoriales cyanobacterium RM2_1_1]|nr:hypothetical protein [Oscillatoriales cyanobacterium SM2_3_0]NJO47176.1 hypothetical protein [Oscillatoriales cyanobacterium RM2_1_1]
MDSQPPSHDPPVHDQDFQGQTHRLHQLIVLGRWLVVSLLWLTIAPLSLWAIRSELQLWFSYFTWTAVRYTIAHNPLPAVGLSLCIGMTAGVLVWQSRNILRGFPAAYQARLERQVLQIRKQGQSHPLWRWVVKS